MHPLFISQWTLHNRQISICNDDVFVHHRSIILLTHHLEIRVRFLLLDDDGEEPLSLTMVSAWASFQKEDSLVFPTLRARHPSRLSNKFDPWGETGPNNIRNLKNKWLRGICFSFEVCPPPVSSCPKIVIKIHCRLRKVFSAQNDELPSPCVILLLSSDKLRRNIFRHKSKHRTLCFHEVYEIQMKECIPSSCDSQGRGIRNQRFLMHY